MAMDITRCVQYIFRVVFILITGTCTAEMIASYRQRSQKGYIKYEGTSYLRTGRNKHFPSMGMRNWLLVVVLTGSAALILLMSRDLPDNQIDKRRDLQNSFLGIGVGASPIGMQNRENDDPDANLRFLRDREGFIQDRGEKAAFSGGDTYTFHRLVHLDLKGAPPRVTYFRQIFPLFKSLGATGLLIEYEDMFPYSGTLASLAARNSYSKPEIQEILAIAKQNNLKVIPLVQTFGHMEFVLKHEQFASLREVPENPQGINPALEQSRRLVYEIINQVMELHPNISHIHLGGDEVYTLGMSDLSQVLMKQHNFDKTGLYIHHVKPVLEYVRSNYKVMSIMWDDMMRKIPLHLLKESNLGSLVEPMVWVYLPQISDRLAGDVWRNFSQVFPNIWTASAFKGATGRRQFITDVNHHRRNHISWVQTIQQQRSYFHRFQGIALTGWQRYDHFAPLCELLPVGIPSLAVCLQTLMHSKFDAHVHQKVSNMLHCEGPVELHLDINNSQYSRCNFPGSEIYEGVHKIHALKHVYDKMRWRYQMYVGDYNVKHGHINGYQIKEFVQGNKTYIMDTVRQINYTMPQLLSQIYYPDLVLEWMEDVVYAPFREASEMLAKTEPLANIHTWSSRPFT